MFDRREFFSKISKIRKNVICLICGKSWDRECSLGTHITRTHKISPKEYYDKYILNGVIPLCVCGKENTFHSRIIGYGIRCGSTCSEAKKGVLNANYNKKHPNMFSEEEKQASSLRLKKRHLNGEKYFCRIGDKYNLSDQEKLRRSEQISRIN